MNAKSPIRKASTKPTNKSANTAAKATRSNASKKSAPKRTTSKSGQSLKPVQKNVEPVTTVSKQARLITLLRSADGASIAQMTNLTGWQPHTVRGTISGVLRKRLRLNVNCAADASGLRIYRIVAAQSA
jgi:hypothetical protein